MPVVVSPSPLALAALPECPVTYPAPAFNPSANSNVAIYWGQGASQDRLVDICQNGAYDIINIGFINQFPDANGYPGANFGNQCGSEVYPDTNLPSNCPWIGQDITTCQEVYGKKIFLSIGGGAPTDYYLADSDYAKAFADFLWKAFGPSQNDGTPRPFGDAVIDGFDFDIESQMTTAPSGAPNYQWQYYPDMINHLHDVLFPEDTSKSYYISAAPQCSFPDAHFGLSFFQSTWVDFVFVQLYNTFSCNAFISSLTGSGDFYEYLQQLSASRNSAMKIYAGLTAGVAGAPSDPLAYLPPSTAWSWIQMLQSYPTFGGVMLWEATVDQENTQGDYMYSEYIKAGLVDCGDNYTPSSDCSFLQYKPNKAQLAVSQNGRCGATYGQTCEGSAFGNCCSQYGNCGSTDAFCSTDNNCDIRYGLCGDDANAAATCTTSTPTPTPTPAAATPADTPIDTPVSNTPVVTPPVDTPVFTPVDTPILTPVFTPINTPVVDTPVFTPINTPVIDTPVFTPINTPVVNTPVFTPPAINTPAANNSVASTPVLTPIVGTPAVNTPVSTPPAVFTPPVFSPIGNLSIHFSTPSASANTPGAVVISSSGQAPGFTGFPGQASSPAGSAPGQESGPTGLPVQASGATSISSGQAPGITSPPTPSGSGSASAHDDVTTTVITTTYIDVCPTGLTTITTTYTTTICPTQTPSAVPSGWTTTVTVCTNCGPRPTTLTLTRPILTAGAPATTAAFTTSTVYATQLVTITACPPSVPNCPANSRTYVSVATSLVPIATTVVPASPVSASSVPTMAAVGSQAGQGSQNGGQSGNANGGSDSGFSTSTVYATQLVTVTACPPSVTNCPANSRTHVSVATSLVPVSTTVVPVPAPATAAAASMAAIGGQGSSPSQSGGSGSNANGGFSTSTVYQTQLVTVTKCPPSVPNCPASAKTTVVVTSAVPAYLTVVPVVATTTTTVAGGSGSGSNSGSGAVPSKQASGSNASGSSNTAIPSAPVQSGVHGGSGSGSGSGSSFSSISISASSSAVSGSTGSSSSGSGGSNGASSVATTTVAQLVTVSVVPVPASSSGSAHGAYYSQPSYRNGTIATPSPLTPVGTPTAAASSGGAGGSKTQQASAPVYTGGAAKAGVRAVGGLAAAAAVVAAAVMGL